MELENEDRERIESPRRFTFKLCKRQVVSLSACVVIVW